MENRTLPESSLLARRQVLKAGALGATALGLIGISPLAEALQTAPAQGGMSDASGSADPRTQARNAREWRANLAQFGTLSLMASEMALRKASRDEVKIFANFEATEQRGVAEILAEMGTRPPALDAASRAIARQHEIAEGVEFDRVYARAQLETHGKLLALQQSLISNTERNARGDERTARYLAKLAIPAIQEHIAHAQALVALLGA